MIIKSHIRGGYRSAADYLKSQGENEKIRLVEISDIDAANLDEAFQNMWKLGCNSKVKKPLHHISINPYKDERLTDAQVMKIIERCELKYGYKPNDHQRVVVEHVKDGRQHFHVMWNRVSLTSGKVTKSGEHWKKSKQVCREMEKELGLKRPMPKRTKRARAIAKSSSRMTKVGGRYHSLSKTRPPLITKPILRQIIKTPKYEQPVPAPVKPVMNKKGWPEAAIIDWETWGHKNPRRFFALWSELAPPGFTP